MARSAGGIISAVAGAGFVVEPAPGSPTGPACGQAAQLEFFLGSPESLLGLPVDCSIGRIAGQPQLRPLPGLAAVAAGPVAAAAAVLLVLLLLRLAPESSQLVTLCHRLHLR